MKKILLIIFTIILILSINVLAVDIDIGCPAIDRANHLIGAKTAINRGNPANATGTITTVEIYANVELTECKVATFYRPNPGPYPDKLSTRDWEAIGTVTAGSKQTFTVALDVQTGDFLGIFYQAGAIERDGYEMDGVWYDSSDCIPCTFYEFSLGGIWAISLYGYSAVGWPHKWNTQTITKWNTQEIIKWNDLE